VQDRYGQLTERLLQSGHRCAIATHDAEFLTRAADRITPGRDRTVEFEMLFGVARRRLEWLRDRGYPVRVYLPYGGGSFLYVCHRLAEHPPNVLLAAADAAEELRLLASGAQL
jgi:proline dehydrogenase